MASKADFQDLAREMAVAAADWKGMRQVPPPQYFAGKLQEYSAALMNLANGVSAEAQSTAARSAAPSLEIMRADSRFETLESAADDAATAIRGLRKRADDLEKNAASLNARLETLEKRPVPPPVIPPVIPPV